MIPVFTEKIIAMLVNFYTFLRQHIFGSFFLRRNLLKTHLKQLQCFKRTQLFFPKKAITKKQRETQLNWFKWIFFLNTKIRNKCPSISAQKLWIKLDFTGRSVKYLMKCVSHYLHFLGKPFIMCYYETTV